MVTRLGSEEREAERADRTPGFDDLVQKTVCASNALCEGGSL
jgi:chloramphenicol 3-O-phosphotransferase